jgi:fatty-acyl-CoA synthase
VSGLHEEYVLPVHLPSGLRHIHDLGRSTGVLLQHGVVRPLRPGRSLRTLRVARRAGPFVAMLEAAGRPQVAAIVDERGPVTYGELGAQSSALARGLAGLGIRAGDSVGVLCRDHRGMVLGLVAAGKLGVRVVLFNTGFGAPQLQDAVAGAPVAAMLVDGEFLPLTDLLPAPLPRVVTWLEDGDPVEGTVPTVEGLVAAGSSVPLPLPSRPGGMVLMTSGTTGRPRGTPRDRISPLQSAQLLDRIPLARGGTTVLATPLFHGTGLGHFVMALTLGSTVVLRRGFDPEATLAAVAAQHADTLVVVPTMLSRLTDLDPAVRERYDTSSLRRIVCGGSALSADLCRRATDAFGDVLYNVYGSTEVANASVATPAELRRAPGTVGRPPVGCRVVLYDEHRAPVITPDRRGTIFASTGMSYVGGADKEVVDGLLCTGDTGHLDEEGLLFIDGRTDDMIVSGGENVFPGEVEDLLIRHPDVREAAVVGVGDADFGTRLRAFVVPELGATPDVGDIKAYVRDNLARYKVPRDVVILDRLPRNAMGKLLRGQLESGQLESGHD